MSSFRRDVLKLASSSGVSQLLLVAATPALSRLYGPDAFGALAVFSSLYSILVGIFMLKFELSILLSKDTEKAIALTRLTLRLSGWFSSIMLFGMIVARVVYLDFPAVYFFLPITIFIGALLSTAHQWASRLKHFGYSSISSISNTVTNLALCFILSYLGFVAEGLIIGYAAGLLAATIYLCLKHSSVFSSSLLLGDVNALALIREYRQFPTHILPNAIVAALAQFSLPIIGAHYFSASAIGLYSMANRVLVLPTALLGVAIADAFRSEFVSRLHRGDDYVALLKKMLLTLVAIAVPSYVGLYLLSPVAFRIVFGDQFADAGTYARYLCAGAAGQFITLPFLYLFIALDRTRAGLMVQATLNILPIVGFVIGAQAAGLDAALIAFSSLSAAGCVILIGFIWFFATNFKSRPNEILVTGNDLIT